MWLSISLDVRGANALNTYCVYGHPSPLAYIGFAHALCARAGFAQRRGALAVIHDFQIRGFEQAGGIHFDMPRSAERDVRIDGANTSQTQIDMPRADLSVSIAFEIEALRSIDTVHARAFETLCGMRFAGGRLAGITEHCVRISATPQEAFALRSGFIMRPHPIELPADDAFPAFMDALSVRPGVPGWRSPTLMGFRMIHEPTGRRGARGGHPHAYADPLIGVVSFVSLREASVGDLWRLKREARGILFVTDASRMETDPGAIESAVAWRAPEPGFQMLPID
jgi:hypothetical protein